ncbi:MAG TPA: DUF2235 domain-containing protein, partial [Chthoniobacterales bacterium]
MNGERPRPRQRLVVCLDGTWNNRDDSTNVFHHFSLALRDAASADGDGFVQTKYYHEGVGTGVLDHITGGGFGFGLEKNVRAAYDWLVEHYHEGNSLSEADEIFIFGFSRGAYTARSLVGFIATCGLLRRGAPLSVNELWDDACVIGREREHRPTIWDEIFGEAPKKIRRITQLVRDPWDVDAASQPNDGKAFPGQLATDLRPGEKLLVRWSRRVRITYLGIYETVGAMGIDALAIPGVKSKLATHFNVRPTSLIQRCRHALAVDEHRSSFVHMPFMQYMPHGGQSPEGQQLNAPSASEPNELSTRDPQDETEAWREKIEQRWFVGAHSNVGGGYPENELALRPLHWLLEGARLAGLKCEPLPNEPFLISPLLPRDSYADFAKPFWTQVIRGKRSFRTIDPEPIRRAATPPKHPDLRQPPSSFSLQTINELVDSSVLDCFRGSELYQPPNLFEYAQRKLLEEPASPEVATWQEIIARKLHHPWLGRAWSAYSILVCWATTAAAGTVALSKLFPACTTSPLPLTFVCAVAFFFTLVDWRESRANFCLALGPTNPRRRAFLDTIYWLRTFGFLLFVCGAVALFFYLWAAGWNADSLWRSDRDGMAVVRHWWPVPFVAGLGVLLANLCDRAPLARQGKGFLGVVLGFAGALAGVFALVFLGALCARICTPALGYTHFSLGAAAPRAQLAGLFLVMQISFLYFFNTLGWVSEPMRRSGLGPVRALQFCFTPAQVTRQLESWRTKLGPAGEEAIRPGTGDHATRAMRAIVREALWRDIFGFIPVYSAVFIYGLWFAAHQLGWDWLSQKYFTIPFWLLLPFISLTADYLEDCCHLRYVALHRAGRAPNFLLPLISTASTTIKIAAIAAAGCVTLAALVAGTWDVAQLGPATGWRGTVALLFCVFGILTIVLIAIGAVVNR